MTVFVGGIRAVEMGDRSTNLHCLFYLDILDRERNRHGIEGAVRLSCRAESWQRYIGAWVPIFLGISVRRCCRKTRYDDNSITDCSGGPHEECEGECDGYMQTLLVEHLQSL